MCQAAYRHHGLVSLPSIRPIILDAGLLIDGVREDDLEAYNFLPAIRAGEAWSRSPTRLFLARVA